MNWDAIGAMGELIGAAAVVVSLVYLAVQIRSQIAESRIAGMHAVSEGFRDAIGSLAENTSVARIWMKSHKDFKSLTHEELVQMFGVAQRNFRVWEEAFGLYQTGRLDIDIFEGITKQYAAFLGHKGFRHVWEHRRDFYNQAFREFVDSLPASRYDIGINGDDDDD